MRIIGIAGNAGSGKDTAADFIVSSEPLAGKFHFADALKEACAVKYGIPLEYFYDAAMKETVNPFWKVTPRQILQFEGTEATRNIIDNLIPGISAGFWIKRLELELQSYQTSGVEAAVIADVRFQNEADWILSQENGMLIRISRLGCDGAIGLANHQSEQGFTVIGGNYHVVMNNGTIEELYKAISVIL